MPASRTGANTAGRSLKRRQFLKTAAAGAAGIFAAPVIVRGRGANDKLNVAVIGCGGRGAHNLQAVAAAGENIIALCDVNQTNLGSAGERHPQAKKFADFRQLFDHAHDFDAVVVSTCEHPHAFASIGHHQEWLQACKTGSPTTCNFEYAGWLTEANHLGNVAFRVGQKLEWDAAKLRAINAPEADAFIHREYRKGWRMA
ncbi:MAG: hypothetical protein B7Z73_03670 [Planctomycetia bacterium 21-64-5]|nr:MAG: hypothetical protein B7Z73_03670 [Planctomycetia bacterium 21-64-5]HQU42436.1 Gfo/Idh/MocA family oxidoreductase [Pirellulales bacterium]